MARESILGVVLALASIAGFVFLPEIRVGILTWWVLFFGFGLLNIWLSKRKAQASATNSLEGTEL